MTGITRRQFLAGSAAAVGAFAISTSTRRVLGAGDDIRVAVVGFHGKGGSHISAFSKMDGVRLVALCDCDMDVLNKGVADCDKKGLKVTPYQDIRKLLEDKNVDAIATATPNHWHSLATVWACQAGKDVYVEKPLSHEIWEGRKATEAARKYKRIVQVGTQSRSDGAIREAYKFIQGGGLGKILLARGFCYKPRGNIGKVTEPTPIPPSIDYDLWCGPAPKKPLMRKKLHYDWHWFWDTGNADIGNQGIHQVDLCRWGLGQNQASPRVMGIGGRFSELIIMDTGPGYRNPVRMAEWNQSREELAKQLETEGISVLVAQATTQGRREITVNQNPIGLAHMSRKVVAQHDSWVIENLDKIKVPTLVLVGENDTPFLQAAQYMEKNISGAKLIVVPKAGHSANIDNAEFFNDSILNFLNNLDLEK